MKRVEGFTLIEILVVIFIISIVTGIAVLTIGRSENKHAETFANELTQLVTLAEEQAVLQTSVVGLSFDKHHFQFSSLQLTQDGLKQNWIPFKDNVLGKRFVPDDLEVGVVIGNNKTDAIDDEKAKTPQIVISANGDVTPFTIYVGSKGKKPRYAISGDMDGNVTSKELL